MRKIKHASKKDYKVFNYKGFDYSRIWSHSSHTNQVGGMRYSVDVPRTIASYNNDSIRGRGDCATWSRAQWAVENLFNYFETAKEMKEALDRFIEYNHETYLEISKEVSNG